MIVTQVNSVEDLYHIAWSSNEVANLRALVGDAVCIYQNCGRALKDIRHTCEATPKCEPNIGCHPFHPKPSAEANTEQVHQCWVCDRWCCNGEAKRDPDALLLRWLCPECFEEAPRSVSEGAPSSDEDAVDKNLWREELAVVEAAEAERRGEAR